MCPCVTANNATKWNKNNFIKNVSVIWLLGYLKEEKFIKNGFKSMKQV